MNYTNQQDNKVHASEFWKTNPEPAIGIFVVANHQGYRAVKKTMTSIKKLGYKKLRTYLIDASSDGRYKKNATKISAKYIASPLSTEQIYEKISGISTVVATVTVTAGVVVKKNMLYDLVPHLGESSDAVAGTLIVTGENTKNSLVGIRKSSLAKSAISSSVIRLPLELASIDGSLFEDDQRKIVERGLTEDIKAGSGLTGYLVSPIIAAALIALVALPAPLILSIDALTGKSKVLPTQDIDPVSSSANKQVSNESTTGTKITNNKTKKEPTVTKKTEMKNSLLEEAKLLSQLLWKRMSLTSCKRTLRIKLFRRGFLKS